MGVWGRMRGNRVKTVSVKSASFFMQTFIKVLKGFDMNIVEEPYCLNFILLLI